MHVRKMFVAARNLDNVTKQGLSLLDDSLYSRILEFHELIAGVDKPLCRINRPMNSPIESH